ncbi:MAG: hypothetical protein HUK02_00005, partial [Bacteroidaceae bacterium]|nr:hypothetical protein [Bacteroidaceae bacterium]
MNVRRFSSRLLGLAIAVAVVSGCSVSRFVPGGHYLLDNVSVHSDDKGVDVGVMKGYIQQHPNSKWFSVVKVPMAPYLLSGMDSTKRINRFFRRIGQAPVIYDQKKALAAQRNMEAAVRGMGYLHARVDLQEKHRRQQRVTETRVFLQRREDARLL